MEPGLNQATYTFLKEILAFQHICTPAEKELPRGLCG